MPEGFSDLGIYIKLKVFKVTLFLGGNQYANSVIGVVFCGCIIECLRRWWRRFLGSGPGAAGQSGAHVDFLSSSSVWRVLKATIGTLNTSDPDGGSFNYTISGDDASSFRVSGNSLQLAAEVAADYETKTSYSITIESTDSGNLSTSKDFTITVIDAVEGRVVDAPLSGSNVFIDLNGNSVQDSDEPNGTSDANGFFIVENMVTEGSPKIISIGGTDTKTGETLPNLALISDLPSDSIEVHGGDALDDGGGCCGHARGQGAGA